MSRLSGWRRLVPRAYGIALAFVAVFCAVEALSDAFRRGVRPVRDAIDAVLIPANGNLAYAVFVGLLAAAVARRKRIAWRLLVIFLAVQVALGLVVLAVAFFARAGDLVANGRVLSRERLITFTVIGLVFTSLFTAILVWARKEFYAPVRHASFRRALAVTGVLLAASVAIGFVIVSIFPGGLTGGAGNRALYAASKVLGGTIRFTGRDLGRAAGWVDLVLGLLGAIAVLAGVATLLSSQRREATLDPGDEQRIRGLLARYGERDSLGYFATRRDKAAVFSPSGKAAVTYRVVNGVSLASGDPIGDVEAWGPAVDEWVVLARRYAWVPAAMGASEDGAVAYQRAGLRVLELGDEAILETDRFHLDGRDMRPVRQAVNRLERAGYTVRVTRHGDLSPECLAEVVTQANLWRDTESERGFSMALGRLGDPSDVDCVLVEAIDGGGGRQALISLSPWGHTGLSLDLMRRGREADNGVMELMVTGLMQNCPRLGVRRVSLNFAVFRSVFEEGARIGAGPILRLWRHTLLFFSRWWQLESLYRSNMKYQPTWVPRYLCYGERRELVKIGIASAVAEGFLQWPPGAKPALLGAEIGSTPVLAADYGPEMAEATEPEDQLPEQQRVRREKLDALRAEGVDPYPVGVERTDLIGPVVAAHAGLAADTRTGVTVAVAGRVMLIRDHGTRAFVDLRDWSGDIQVMLDPASDVGGFLRHVDIGDHVAVTGEVVTSKRGQLSVGAATWRITAKCLRPLPDKHKGLADPEARVRRRYLDLITSPDARDVLRARSAAIHSLRDSLHARDFVELETPILQRVHGGANARPFKTHINAYDMDLYLRIAPELYLKRLAVGGVERLFELGRTFRNEGVSFKHNPEFTMLEVYQAYADYTTMLDLTRELIQAAALAANGTAVVRWPGSDGAIQEIDIAGDWPVLTVNEAISAALGEEVTADTTPDALRALCEARGVPCDPKWSRGAVVLELYERLVEHHTVAPTFYKDFPTDVSPLTREHRTDPRLAERWDLVAFGTELGTAYSELTDPVEQRRRLTEQSLLAANGDSEAMELDEDFLTAMEFGLPPTGGLGLGVDRLVMLLTGRTIRETLPFPMVRPG
jgi:lysyl-tRNA synthetase class 2